MVSANTPEALKKLAEKLLFDLLINDDCDKWDCSDCPLRLKEVEVDPRHGKHNCGWLLLRSATRKILEK